MKSEKFIYKLFDFIAVSHFKNELKNVIQALFENKRNKLIIFDVGCYLGFF